MTGTSCTGSPALAFLAWQAPKQAHSSTNPESNPVINVWCFFFFFSSYGREKEKWKTLHRRRTELRYVRDRELKTLQHRELGLPYAREREMRTLHHRRTGFVPRQERTENTTPQTDRIALRQRQRTENATALRIWFALCSRKRTENATPQADCLSYDKEELKTLHHRRTELSYSIYRHVLEPSLDYKITKIKKFSQL